MPGIAAKSDQANAHDLRPHAERALVAGERQPDVSTVRWLLDVLEPRFGRRPFVASMHIGWRRCRLDGREALEDRVRMPSSTRDGVAVTWVESDHLSFDV